MKVSTASFPEFAGVTPQHVMELGVSFPRDVIAGTQMQVVLKYANTQIFAAAMRMESIARLTGSWSDGTRFPCGTAIELNIF